MVRRNKTVIDGKKLSVVEKGEWEQDHKIQTSKIIFSDGEKFFRGYIGRSGSPYTDWTYDSEVIPEEIQEVDEVEKKTVMVEKWVKI